MPVQETYSQIQSLLASAQKVLLVTRKGPNPDGVAALLSLFDYLKNMGKEVSLLAEDIETKVYQYLPEANRVQKVLPPQNLIIAIDLARSPVERINYETKGDRLELIITPRQGPIDPKQVEFVQRGLNTDLVISVDAPSLGSLGQLSSVYQEALNKLPLINIDNNPANSLYGKINWIDAAKVSLTQMLYDFFVWQKLDISKQMAFTILAGIYFRTFGFRKGVSPEIFQVSAALLKQGADYHEVVKNVKIAALPETPAETQALLDQEYTRTYIR